MCLAAQVRVDFPSLAALSLSDVRRRGAAATTSQLPSLAGLTSLSLRLEAHSSERLKALAGGTSLLAVKLAIMQHLKIEHVSSVLVSMRPAR